ncbi:MAG: helix-turn-helix domain-containing protein [Oscillospiraceae bacterium]|nr:helix-turn-helix domain-containing protein [Oscillospiraceae bacterium]
MIHEPTVITSTSPLFYLPLTAETLCTRKQNELHWHDYVQMWYVFSGTMKHTLGGKTYFQTPGSCVVVLPYVEHSIDTLESEDTPVVLSISFTDRYLIDLGYRFFSYSNKHARFEEKSIPSFHKFENENKEIADSHLRNILSEFSRKSEMDFGKIATYLTDFFRLLCQESADDNNMICITERANSITTSIRYMADHLGEKITLDDLASVAMMSRRMFTDNFKAVTGTTSAKFLLALRITKAQYLLLFTQKSLSEIASDIGLYDKARLVNAFSSLIGMPPIKFREKYTRRETERDKELQKRWAWLDASPFKKYNQVEKQ